MNLFEIIKFSFEFHGSEKNTIIGAHTAVPPFTPMVQHGETNSRNPTNSRRNYNSDTVEMNSATGAASH